MAEELDDWLDNLSDDGDAEAGDAEELDQSDIDSLLSGEAAPALAEATAEVDDGAEDGELDQSDIDSLLSGEADPAPAEAAAEVDGADDGELDQSDIDSLLAGDTTPADSEPDNAEELDQSDIDSLLSADDAEPSADSGDDEEFNQDDIDSLLAGTSDSGDSSEEAPGQDSVDDLLGTASGSEGATQPELSPDQEEIDRLFSEIDDDATDEPDPFQAEEIEFDDLLSSDTDDTFLATGNEFASDEFDLNDDIPDIPDIPDDQEETVILDSKDGAAAGTVAAKSDGEATEDLDPASVSDKGTANFLPVAIPAILQERRNQAIAGALFMLLAAGLAFLFMGGDEPAQVAVVSETTKVQEPQAVKAAAVPVKVINNTPQVDDLSVNLEGADPVAIILAGHDSEGDKLQYELLSQPEHGKLSGAAPLLVYTPAADFPGQDQFDFRVNDGTAYSPSAIVTISGKVMVQVAAKRVETVKTEPKAIKPRKIIVQANNYSYSVVGTKALYVDWEKVWRDANFLPYSQQIKVEIISKGEHGRVEKINDSVSAYKADKYYGGADKIRYRFVLGRLKSKIRTLNLQVSPGNPAPEIRLAGLSQDSYRPGELVQLDASRSRDDRRRDLIFTWEQIGGPKVLLTDLNREGSRVSFVAPSSFNTVANPGPLMRLTITDPSGKTAEKIIKVATKSRYKSAIWGKVAGY